jgi:hypothetical protein
MPGGPPRLATSFSSRPVIAARAKAAVAAVKAMSQNHIRHCSHAGFRRL